MRPATSMADETAPLRRWLSIVGVGEDGVDGLSLDSKRLVGDADVVFGGARHIELMRSIIRGDVRPWSSPFRRAIAEVLEHRGRSVCVLASGDPFFYGVGVALTRYVDPRETHVVPSVSAFSLAAARLGWSLPETALISLCGRPLDLVRPHLHPGCKILALTSNGAGPQEIAALLASIGFGDSLVTVLEALGGPRERIRSERAGVFALTEIAPLNIVAINVRAAADARIISRTPGLADRLYEHDGQMTKREVRALTLSALAPRRHELLWDIGAGAGSVGIEWMLSDPSLRAVAIEADPPRAQRIRRNAAAFGVPDLVIVEGKAPGALAGLPAPQAIFVGGGATEPGMLDAAVASLGSGGRLVVNAVTVETEAFLLARYASHGGNLARIALSSAAPVGGMTGWRAAMPITQWVWIKP